jgi:glutamyl/glutaminyl-tRNA synthetase
VDHTRRRPGFAESLEADLAWLGIDWDELHVQSAPAHRAAQEAALDRLAASGLLYPCRCTRKILSAAAGGRRAPDGSIAYDNRCRGRPLPPGGWRDAAARGHEPLRLALPDRAVTLLDEGGLDLSQDPARDMGDPVLVRRDGAFAYHLAVVVDDAAAGVTRIVRGRDIAPSTATHHLLQDLLGLPHPIYRHHFLLLEPRGGKLAKLHGSIPARLLRPCYTADDLVGLLAAAAGILPAPAPVRPADLVPRFGWDRVRTTDLSVTWTGSALVF